MILDLEGARDHKALSPRLWWILSIASAAVAVATLLVVSALPHEGPARPVATGPSILEQAVARSSPQRLGLVLPADIAVPLPPGAISDAWGNGRSRNSPRSYRLRATNDVVSVAPLPDAVPIPHPPPLLADALAVHGQSAQGWTVEPTSLSVLRWTENGSTYEISSRTLMPKELARIADLLR